MPIEQFAVVILVCIGFVAILSIVIAVSVRKTKRKYINYIFEKSTKAKALQDLNEKTEFETDIEDKINFREEFLTKQKYDSFDFFNYLCDKINRSTALRINIEKIQYNLKISEGYEDAVLSMSSTFLKEDVEADKMDFQRVLEYENRVFDANIFSPEVDLEINICVSYDGGSRDDYWEKSELFLFEDIEKAYKAVVNKHMLEQTKEYQVKKERSKITSTMRYEVLQRDAFACKVCGATASDGAKLHVDHITPVSKGGPSILSNLRTLCEKCNRGKGAKLDKD